MPSFARIKSIVLQLTFKVMHIRAKWMKMESSSGQGIRMVKDRFKIVK